MSVLIDVAVRAVQIWADLYTWRLPSELRDTRRAEIASDLWEHRQVASVADEQHWQTAMEIVVRFLMGLPADLSWRFQTGAFVRSKQRSARVTTGAGDTHNPFSYDYAHFTLDKLDRTLPIAQIRRIGEMDFALLALECYREGFVATVLLEQDWRAPDPPPSPGELETPLMLQGLQIVSNAADDLGNPYVANMRAGSGGGGADGPLRSHLVYSFQPALDPGASNLTFTLTLVDRPRYGADGQPAWNDDQVVGGPWELSFALNAASLSDPAPMSVLPISGRVAVNDVGVTLATLERHAWGFVVNSRVDWSGADSPFPRLTMRATDDRGRSYGTGNCAGGGSILDDDANSWRMHCSFEPSLDPESSELILRIDSVGFRQPVRSESENSFEHWKQVREVSDVGEFTVKLRE